MDEANEMGQFIEEAYKLNFPTEDILQGVKIFDITRFSIGKLLGEGAFGYVYELKDLGGSGASYALKIVLKTNKKFNIVKDEAKIQAKFKHPNIVTVNLIFDTNDYIAIVMEKCGVDLYLYKEQVMKKIGSRITWEFAVKIFKEVVKGVSYIHDQGYAHRDIKLENIMKCQEGAWKLIDFGYTVLSTEKLKDPCCTLDYMAPEVLETLYWNIEFYLGQPTDIWALGILLYELIFEKSPFYRKTHRQTYEAIQKDSVVFPGTYDVPEKVKSLIEKMLDKNPKTRITIKEVEQRLNF